MILGQISYLDCIVFIIFLAPQLLIHVNIFELLSCVFQALPFFRRNFLPIQHSLGLFADEYGSIPASICFHN